jgi:hypothetical protein
MEQRYKKVIEGKQTSFLIPIKEIDDGTVHLDITRIIRNAINKDRRNEYVSEDGPTFWIEMTRALDYADYVMGCDVTNYNYHKFNTKRGYSFFIQSNV